MKYKLFADFNNADKQGRVRLNSIGTLEDVEKSGVQLEEGIKVLLDDLDGLMIEGTIQYSHDENIWVAEIDWNKLNK